MASLLTLHRALDALEPLSKDQYEEVLSSGHLDEFLKILANPKFQIPTYFLNSITTD